MHKMPRPEKPWEGCVPIQPEPIIIPVTWCRWFCHFTKRLSKLGYGWIPTSSTIPQPLGQTWKWTIHKQVRISMMLPLTEIFQFPIPSQRTPVTDSINCPSLLSWSLPPAQIKQIAPHSSDPPPWLHHNLLEMTIYELNYAGVPRLAPCLADSRCWGCFKIWVYKIKLVPVKFPCVHLGV